MIFRHATQADLPVIVDIYNSTVPLRTVTADTAPVSVADRQRWFGEHSPAAYPLWMVEGADGEAIGWVSLQAFHPRPAYRGTAEISIYLHPDWRGKKLGTEILLRAMEQARQVGVKTLVGLIFAHNAPSLRLFCGHGFEEWGHLPNVAEIDGSAVSLKIVGKRIA